MGSRNSGDSCDVCGKDLLLYKCKYCGKIYCEEHRHPKNHKCPGISEYKAQVESGTIERPGVTASPSAAPSGEKPGITVASVIKGALLATKIFSIALIIVACLVALVLLIGFVNTQLPEVSASIPVQNTTGVQVVLANNRTAADPTYDQLIAFLRSDDTSSMAYVSPTWTCADFAKRLHDNAEAKGIKAGFVAVEFYNSSIDYAIYDDGSGSFSPPESAPDIGHGFNVFNTTDRGLVYVDPSSIYEGSSEDRIVYVAEGREFNEIDLVYATSADYSFYTGYRQKYLDYAHNLKEYNRLAKDYNRGILPAGMNQEQASLFLKNKSDSLIAEKAAMGPFYFPSGVVKTINVYW